MKDSVAITSAGHQVRTSPREPSLQTPLHAPVAWSPLSFNHTASFYFFVGANRHFNTICVYAMFATFFTVFAKKSVCSCAGGAWNTVSSQRSGVRKA